MQSIMRWFCWCPKTAGAVHFTRPSIEPSEEWIGRSRRSVRAGSREIRATVAIDDGDDGLVANLLSQAPGRPVLREIDTRTEIEQHRRRVLIACGNREHQRRHL